MQALEEGETTFQHGDGRVQVPFEEGHNPYAVISCNAAERMINLLGNTDSFFRRRHAEGVLTFRKEPRLVEKFSLLEVREAAVHNVFGQLGNGLQQQPPASAGGWQCPQPVRTPLQVLPGP